MSDILEILRRGAGPKDVDRAADEITRLRADLAAVTEERDRMLRHIKIIAGQPLSSELDAEEQDGADYEGAYDGFIRDARAEIEGVTEKKNG